MPTCVLTKFSKSIQWILLIPIVWHMSYVSMNAHQKRSCTVQRTCIGGHTHTHKMTTHPLPMHLVHSSKNRVTFTTSFAWTMIDLPADLAVIGGQLRMEQAQEAGCGLWAGGEWCFCGQKRSSPDIQDTFSDNCQRTAQLDSQDKFKGQIDQTFTRSNSRSFVRQRSFSFYVRSDFAPLLLGTNSDIIFKFRIQTDM